MCHLMLHFLSVFALYVSFLLVVLLLNVASKCNTKMPSGVSVLRRAVMCLVGIKYEC